MSLTTAAVSETKTRAGCRWTPCLICDSVEHRLARCIKMQCTGCGMDGHFDPACLNGRRQACKEEADVPAQEFIFVCPACELGYCGYWSNKSTTNGNYMSLVARAHMAAVAKK